MPLGLVEGPVYSRALAALAMLSWVRKASAPQGGRGAQGRQPLARAGEPGLGQQAGGVSAFRHGGTVFHITRSRGRDLSQTPPIIPPGETLLSPWQVTEILM